MTTAPYIELGYHPTDLRMRDIPRTGAYLGTPASALEAAIAVTRAAMVDEMKDQVRGLTTPSAAAMLQIADLTWQLVFWRFRRISAPVLAEAYLRAYRRADAGDVPLSVIYDLADKHAEKIGEYFHLTSREALADGFNILVNRRVPAKVAADRVLDAYGLTPRQMRGLIAGNDTFATPITTALPQGLRAKIRNYIDKSFTTRVRKLARQEEHNIDEQAKQLAWMWLQDKDRLPQNAQKMWITAHDERVCPVCGPLHGQKIGLNEKFKTKHGDFWTPGLHPNCRCVVRLIENRFSKSVNAFGIVDKALSGGELSDFNRKHPRGGVENKGRFVRKPPRRGALVAERQAEADIKSLNRFLEQAQALHEEEQKKPVIEVAPEKIGLEGPLISAREISAGKIGVEQKIGLDQEKIGAEEEKISGKPRISLEEIEEQIKLTPAAKLKLVAEEEKILAADAAKYHPPVVPPKKLYHKPTIFVHDVTGRERPYYAVVNDSVINDGVNYRLTHETLFVPNEHSLYQEIVEQREIKIRDAIDQVVNDTSEDPPLWHPVEGSQFSPDVDVADLEGPIRWLANGAKPAEDFTQPITWVDRSGGRHVQYHSFSQIIDMLGYRATNLDLEVKVMRLTEAHDSWKGQTVHHRAGTFTGKESWVTDGDYRMKRMTRHKMPFGADQLIGTTIVTLEPDVEEVELPTILGGEWPEEGR